MLSGFEEERAPVGDPAVDQQMELGAAVADNDPLFGPIPTAMSCVRRFGKDAMGFSELMVWLEAEQSADYVEPNANVNEANEVWETPLKQWNRFWGNDSSFSRPPLTGVKSRVLTNWRRFGDYYKAIACVGFLMFSFVVPKYPKICAF